MLICIIDYIPQDIPTGADSCVTSMCCDSFGKSLIVAGCGDGSVRLFDRRMPPNDSLVMTFRYEECTTESICSNKNEDFLIMF